MKAFYTNSTGIQYGCVFCRTGLEKLVAFELEQNCEILRATPVSQIKHKSVNGIKMTQHQILLPGYVFFSTPCNPNAISLKRVHGVLRYLKDIGGDWCLSGHDLRFAEWIFQYDGIIGLSQAYIVGDRVHIHSGPLKDYEGSIIKIDKRSRNGLVEIKFDQKVWKVWLAFDLTESAKESPLQP